MNKFKKIVTKLALVSVIGGFLTIPKATNLVASIDPPIRIDAVSSHMLASIDPPIRIDAIHLDSIDPPIRID